MDRNAIIDTLQQRGGFITTGEVKSCGEYEQLRRATEDCQQLKDKNYITKKSKRLQNM